MKKIIAILLVAALFIGTVFTITSCSDKDHATGNTATEDSVTKEPEIPEIVGEWKNDTAYSGLVFTYTFNEDGTGQYDAAGNIMPFTYETDDDKISILYEGNTDPFETTFSIDGKTLNVVDSLGKDTLYERVK